MPISRYSREIIEKKLQKYLDAEDALLSSKSYKIGTRELTRLDLKEIQIGRAYWENELNKLDKKNNRRVKIGVHRSI
nr:MAG TPA: head to tail adaptor [Caudoviricetes sp.]